MPTVALSIQSQAVVIFNDFGGEDLFGTGSLFSGDTASFNDAASAVRFELPTDLESDSEIISAVINLRIRRVTPSGNSDQRHRIGVLDFVSHALPATFAELAILALHTGLKNIGTGTFSPALDHIIGTSYESISVDLTDSLQDALDAGQLDDGFVVVILRPINYSAGHHIQADGTGQTTPATLDLEYSESASRQLSLDAPISAWTLAADAIKLTEIAALDSAVTPWTLDAAAETQNTVSLEQPFPQWSQSSLAASPILGQVIQSVQSWTLDASAQNGDGRQAALVADIAAWTLEAAAAVGYSATVNQSLTPWTLESAADVTIRVRTRSLIPAQLFP